MLDIPPIRKPSALALTVCDQSAYSVPTLFTAENCLNIPVCYYLRVSHLNRYGFVLPTDISDLIH